MPPVARYLKIAVMTDLRLHALLLVALLLGSAASAGGVDHREVLELRRQGTLLPFEEILQVIQKRYPGSQVFEVELDRDDDRYIYEVEILTATGQFRELELDARTGAVLEDELED